MRSTHRLRFLRVIRRFGVSAVKLVVSDLISVHRRDATALRHAEKGARPLARRLRALRPLLRPGRTPGRNGFHVFRFRLARRATPHLFSLGLELPHHFGMPLPFDPQLFRLAKGLDLLQQRSETDEQLAIRRFRKVSLLQFHLLINSSRGQTND